MYERPNWNAYYLNIAKAVSARSTCLRKRYGAIIVKDGRIISTGYNGAASGVENCCDTGKCVRKEMNIPSGERYELCKSVHAESNAIINGTKSDMINSTIYIYGEEDQDDETTKVIIGIPCLMCSRVIVNAGIKYVVNIDGTHKSIVFVRDFK
jgi:dCMP deaminase